MKSAPIEIKCTTSYLWPDLIPPGINKYQHSEARSQQKQQTQRRQSKEPGNKIKWKTET